MALTISKIRLTDDHTSETAAEVMSYLQLDQGSPKAKKKCQMLLSQLDFQSEHRDEEEYSQFVFHGQCLILGDCRVGKTSLVKSLTGKPFDSEEPSTKAAHTTLVDRKWQNADLKFGSFARFGKSARFVDAMFTSGEYDELTSVAYEDGKLSHYMFWLMYLLSLIVLWVIAKPSFTFCVFSLVVVFTYVKVYSSFVFNNCFMHSLSIHFIMGLVAGHILAGFLRGINCCCVKLPCISLKHLHLFLRKFIVCYLHLFCIQRLTGRIISDLLSPLTEKYIRLCFLRCQSDFKFPLPGQVKIYNHRRVLYWVPCLLHQIESLVNGLGLGCIVELSIDKSVLSYCEILHYTVILGSGLSILWFIRSLWRGRNVLEGIVSPIIFICVIEYTPYSFASSYSTASYVAMLTGCACCVIILTYNLVLKHFDSIYKFIYVQKVTLDYPKLRDALNTKFASLKLRIVDFSGDQEHFAYHHLFHRNQALYVVVFNMAHFVADNFQNIPAKIQRLCFWLESIHSKVAPKIPIFLVGTHRGNMNQACLDCLNKHLQQSLWKTFSDELTMNKEDKLMYFPVENKHGRHDRGIQNLQRAMICIAEEYKTTLGCTIPFAWIKIQDAIINMWNNEKAKFCVSLKHFPTSFADFICSNWSKETLKYFHEKGLVIYIDRGENSELSKWVLLKPSLLVDITIQLITPPTDEELMSQDGFRRDWTLLHNTGMLTESLLRHILTRMQEHEEALVGFLEENGIICPLFYKGNNEMTEAKVTHFVPALLPISENENMPVWDDHPIDKRLFVFFKRFLPESLFHHLLSRAHKLSVASVPKGQPIICRNVGRFWFTPTQPYRLLVRKEEDLIEVTFSCR